MATVGQLIVELRASTASFAGDLGKANQLSFNTAREMERSFRRIGIAVTAALGTAATATVALAAKSLDTADKMGKMAQAAGVSVEAFSGLAYAARLSDVSTEQLGAAFTNMARSLDRANNTTSQSQAAVRGLKALFDGSIPTFKNAEDAFTQIADRISKLPDGMQKSAIAMAIFRDPKLIAFLNEGADGLARLRLEAAAFGLVISQETFEAAQKFNDTLTSLRGAVQGLGLLLADQLLPYLQAAATALKEAAKNAETMQRVTAVLATSVKLAATAVLGLWSALVDLANLLSLIVSPLAGIEDLGKRIAHAIIHPLTGIPLLIDAIVKSFDGMKASFLSSLEEFKKGSVAAELIDKIWFGTGLVVDDLIKKNDDLGDSWDDLATRIKHSFSSILSDPLFKRFQDLNREAFSGRGGLDRVLDQGAPNIGQPDVPLLDLEKLGLAQGATVGELPLTGAVAQLSDKFKELRPLAQEVSEQLGGLFEQAIFHADSFVDALGKVAQAIAAMALRMLVIQPLLDALGGLFSLGVSSPAGVAGGRGGIPLGLPLPGSFRAHGGPVTAGTPYVVGEQGPEMFVPNVSGMVVPNNRMGGTSYSFTFNGVTDADSFKRSKGQIAAFMQQQLAIAGARNG